MSMEGTVSMAASIITRSGASFTPIKPKRKDAERSNKVLMEANRVISKC